MIDQKNPHKLLTFTCHGISYGIDVTFVQEVIRSQPLTRVPLAPPCVAGLINLRGSIVTTLDLATRLQLSQEPKPHSETMCIILNVGDEVVSLLVDAVGDLMEVPPVAYHAHPSPLSPNLEPYVLGVCRTTDTNILDLDPHAICAVTTMEASYEESARC